MTRVIKLARRGAKAVVLRDKKDEYKAKGQTKYRGYVDIRGATVGAMNNQHKISNSKKTC
jgi:hypothetical protein